MDCQSTGFRGLLFLGGGLLTLELCRSIKLVDNNVSLFVLSSPRHLGEVFRGATLEAHLLDAGIRFSHVESFNEDTLRNLKLEGLTEYFPVSCGAPWIFKSRLTSRYFRRGIFNIHGTRLPDYRGGGMYTWQVMGRNRFGYSLIHEIDDGIDTGSIIFVQEFLYPGFCRKPIHYYEEYVKQNTRILPNILIGLVKGEFEFSRMIQPEYLSKYWPRVNTGVHSWIDWGMGAFDLEAFICAFDDPYEGAQTFINGQKVFIRDVYLNTQDGNFAPFQFGLIYRVSPGWICVACRGGALIIREVRDEMGECLLGALKVGDRFHTPSEIVDQAYRTRVKYTSTGLKVLRD